MSEEEKIVAKTKDDPELKKLWWTKPSYLAALCPAVFVLSALVYGLANGYVQVSFVNPEDRTNNLTKQTEELQSEIAKLEQKRAKILEQLEKTNVLLDKSKNSSAEVDAHIQVLSSSCVSCPTPAWVQSYKSISAALEEIEKILNEGKQNAPAK